MKFWGLLNFFLTSLLVLLIQFAGCFTISCCMLFDFLRKQGKGVLYVLNRAILFFKNLKNILKQCVSYSNFRIFLNIWKILVLNHRIWMFFSLFTYFSAIMLKGTIVIRTYSLETRAVLMEIFMLCWNLPSGPKHWGWLQNKTLLSRRK